MPSPTTHRQPGGSGVHADQGPAAISTTGLSKSYGETSLLDGVDLTVGDGKIFALLGPNGAGKTTLVRLLSTLIPADSGCVADDDLAGDSHAVCSVIGATGQFSAVDDLHRTRNPHHGGRLAHLGRA